MTNMYNFAFVLLVQFYWSLTFPKIALLLCCVIRIMCIIVFYYICRILRNQFLPAKSSEPRQVVGMVHPVANGNNFLEALNLDSHDLCQKNRIR